jgi:hypothetical protein
MTFYSRDAEYACAVDGHCLVVLKSDQETYADRLAARVAELDAELDLILKAVQWANAENDKLKSELAAEKEENRKLRMTIGVMEMKEKVRGL